MPGSVIVIWIQPRPTFIDAISSGWIRILIEVKVQDAKLRTDLDAMSVENLYQAS